MIGFQAMRETTIKDALAHVAGELRRLRKNFALVGGLAVSVRGDVRTTRDVDLAVAVADDAETEALAASEDLLAMKLLSAREGRARDWDYARGLVRENPVLDLALVRERLGLICIARLLSESGSRGKA